MVVEFDWSKVKDSGVSLNAFFQLAIEELADGNFNFETYAEQGV